MSNNLGQRIIETYKETRNTVKIGDKETEEFWTVKDLRQGCPLSPTLFIYVIDLEEKMKKEQEGGIVIGKKKFWTISYADDVILLARREIRIKRNNKKIQEIFGKERTKSESG